MKSVAIVFALLMFNSQGDPNDWRTANEFMYMTISVPCLKLQRSYSQHQWKTNIQMYPSRGRA